MVSSSSGYADVIRRGQRHDRRHGAQQHAATGGEPPMLLLIWPGRDTELIVPDCRTYTHE